MYFMIVGTDYPDSLEKRMSVRAAHLERIQHLTDEGRLLIAGPNPISEDEQTKGFSGSLIVAEFTSLDEAKRWTQDDPYQVTGVYEQVIVKPFKKVLP